MPEDKVDLTKIKNSEDICWDYTTDPYEDEDLERDWQELATGVWISLKPMTLAIAQSTQAVGLNAITKSNIIEWYYRLSCLFDAGESFLYLETQEGNVPMRISPVDLRKHIGLECKVKLKSKEEFDLGLRDIRVKNILSEGFK